MPAHAGLWTEDDLLDLPRDGQRYELVEGTLVVNPPPSGRHQLSSWQLASQLKANCPPHLVVVEGLGVRLPEGTLLIPDLLVCDRTSVMEASPGIVDAPAVHLVAEIVSPSSRTADRLTKPALYASGGIGVYLRVELDEGPAIFAGARSARAAEVLQLDEPYPITLRPGELLD